MKTSFKILVADDDADDQQLIASALNNLDLKFDIIPVHNGLEALDYLLRRNAYKHVTEYPDLIFLDLNMPLMDGFEVLKGIRMQQALESLPIYVITVSKNSSDKSKAKELGATGFYSKGSRTSDLSLVVKDILDKNYGRSLRE